MPGTLATRTPDLPVAVPVSPEKPVPVPVPQATVPGVLVDLDGQLGLDLLGGANPESKPGETRAPAVLTQFHPQSGNQARIDQVAFQDCLQLDLGGREAAALQHVDDISEPNGRFVSPAELSKICNAFYDSSHIPFEYIKDGCYARAHLMCESLRQHGINHSKVFVFGSLGAKNEVQDTKWWYHVAPLVFVQDPQTGAVDARVIDPGLSREPMTVQDWVKGCNRGGAVKLDVTQAAQYFPREGKGPETDFAKNLGYAQRTCLNYSDNLQELVPNRQGPARGQDMALGQTEELKLFPEGLPAPAETVQDPRVMMAAVLKMTNDMMSGALSGMYGGLYGGMLGTTGFGMGTTRPMGPSLYGPGFPGGMKLIPDGMGGPPSQHKFVPYGMGDPGLPGGHKFGPYGTGDPGLPDGHNFVPYGMGDPDGHKFGPYETTDMLSAPARDKFSALPGGGQGPPAGPPPWSPTTGSARVGGPPPPGVRVPLESRPPRVRMPLESKPDGT